MNLGAALKHARERSGLSLREVAAQAGCAHTYVVWIEAGKSSPTVAKLEALCAVYGLRVSTLIRRAEGLPEPD